MDDDIQYEQGASAALTPNIIPSNNHPRYSWLLQDNYRGSMPQPSPFHHPRPTMPSSKSEKRKQEILTCDACGIEVNSQQMMDVHIRGQKHIKKMKLKAGIQSTTNLTPTNTNDEQNSSESVPSTDSTSTPTTKPAATINDKSVLQLMNELAKHNKVNIKYDLIKETGPAHCKQFEVQLTVADETYIGTGTSIKRAQQVAAERALAVTSLKRPDLTPKGSHSARIARGGTTRGMYRPAQQLHSTYQIRPRFQPPRDQRPNNSIEDKFQNLLERRSSDISEDENIIRTLHHAVGDIERALKIVSDKLMATCQLDNHLVVPQLPPEAQLNITDQDNEDPTESFRMLKGSMKVSILAMRLYLKSDQEYTLVLICANKPSLALLNEICQELTVALNAQAIESIRLETNGQQSIPATYQVEKSTNQSSLDVKCNLLPNRYIRIMLTSPVFRTENYLHFDEKIRQQIEQLNPDPIDMLDKNRCLAAAAEIRHSNWFTHCMLGNNTNLIVLRLLRSLQHERTPLSCLSLWSLALLVHKCQSQSVTTVSQLFRLVFACLSSGILLPNHIGPGIIDPCEKDVVDASADLSITDRLSITDYAQSILRFIALEHYDEIFSQQSQRIDDPIMHSLSNEEQMT